jgi:hypothetical protein
MYIFYYCLLHSHMCPILQSGGYIMYSYMFPIIKDYFVVFASTALAVKDFAWPG